MSYIHKKRYCSPTLISVKVDQEITLMMVSPPPVEPDSPVVPKAPSDGSLQENNPFGGDKPDYSKM